MLQVKRLCNDVDLCGRNSKLVAGHKQHGCFAGRYIFFQGPINVQSVSIADKNIDGYKGIELLKRINNGEAEFITIMYFESLDAVKHFAGENYEVAVVPENARRLLLRYDNTSQHYEILKQQS